VIHMKKVLNNGNIDFEDTLRGIQASLEKPKHYHYK